MSQQRKETPKIRIAVVVSGTSVHAVGGIHSVAMNRYAELMKRQEFDAYLFFIQTERVLFSPKNVLKSLRHVKIDVVDGYNVKVLLKREFFSNCRLFRKPLKLFYRWTRSRLQDWGWQQRLGKYLKGYDLISAHFNDAALVAKGAWKRFGIPYCVTWHGSDIHTIPLRDDVARVATIEAMENASCNFFVSQQLLLQSNVLTENCRKEVLYNAIDKIFCRYEKNRRRELREQFGVSNQKVVTFAGSLRDVKNADLLPELFARIAELSNSPLTFWIVGEGILRNSIEKKLKDIDINCLLWGSYPHEFLPNLFNCTDVLVLPSKNEGFPLVILEALACGANVVGSAIGGIQESIGKEFCSDIQTDNIDDFAELVVRLLKNPCPQSPLVSADWNDIVAKEVKIYHQVLKK